MTTMSIRSTEGCQCATCQTLRGAEDKESAVAEAQLRLDDLVEQQRAAVAELRALKGDAAATSDGLVPPGLKAILARDIARQPLGGNGTGGS